MKDGDKLLQELAEKRHEAEKRHRLALLQYAMIKYDNDICPICGANRKNYFDTMGEDCSHGHGRQK